VGPPSKLSITTQPSSSAQSGVAFPIQPAVQVLDAANLPVPGVAVTAAIASGGGNLGGTATVTSDANGLASFTDLSISGIIGDRTLSFSASGVPTVVSNTITLTAGPASQLTITREPPSVAITNMAFLPSEQPIIQVRDAAGNGVGGVTVAATLNNVSGSGGGLGGTTVVTTDPQGVATYTNLKITKGGTYTITFSVSPAGSPAATSIMITVAP
jgi:adhesin/invasin